MVTVVVVVVRRRFDLWRVGRGEMGPVCFEFSIFICVVFIAYVCMCAMCGCANVCQWLLVSTLRMCYRWEILQWLFGTAFGSHYFLGV